MRTTGRLSPSATPRHWHYLPTAPRGARRQTAEVEDGVTSDKPRSDVPRTDVPRTDVPRLVLGVALVMGLAVRLAPILISDFPLRDGGLFVTMARDLRDAGFTAPLFSTFNAGDIPFAYPPLGIVLLALMPGDPIEMARWLPLAWSMLAIVAAWLLARELTDDLTGAMAALLFAAMPITWAIEGGGVARAPGLALLLLAIWRVAVLLRSPSAMNVAFAGLTGALALLSHPVAGPTGLASAALLLASRPSWRGAVALPAAGVVALLAAGPWLLSVLARYGPESLLTATGAHDTSPALARLLIFGPTWLGAFDFVVPFAVLGLAMAIHRRTWFVPAWLALLLMVPGGEGRHAALAWAMLAAIGVQTAFEAVKAAGAQRVAAGIGIGFIFFVSLIAGYRRFDAVPAGVRQAIIQAGQTSEPGTRFAVIAGDPSDSQPLLDWFPTLSGRISVGTYQGLEFTTTERWMDAVETDEAIQAGDIPPDVDEVFRETDGGGTIEPAP
jgi:hypothetical protein